MSNRNGKVIHGSLLKPSSPDSISLCNAVEEKFKLLCSMFFNMRGVHLIIPEYLNADMLNWRKMAVRFKRGDFRNTDGERESLINIAKWTLDVKSKLSNQPTPRVDWGD